MLHSRSKVENLVHLIQHSWKQHLLIVLKLNKRLLLPWFLKHEISAVYWKNSCWFLFPEMSRINVVGLGIKFFEIFSQFCKNRIWSCGREFRLDDLELGNICESSLSGLVSNEFPFMPLPVYANSLLITALPYGSSSPAYVTLLGYAVNSNAIHNGSLWFHLFVYIAFTSLPLNQCFRRDYFVPAVWF